jgi:peptide/nickel transport system ATP-binding protein
MALLGVKNLRTYFYNREETAKAVDGVSFEVNAGETLCIVGESGCGKSVTALSILRLIAEPGKIVGGEIIFKGKDLLALPDEAMRKIRGDEISMIFQEPMTSLNPVFTCGDQIRETIELHQNLSRAESKNKAIGMLRKVGLPDPETRWQDYPHQLSGGMRQRVMIAMALACQPALVIADEPTTALDVTVQAQILELIKKQQAEGNMAMILITHDFGIVAEAADTVAVMYASKIVEYGHVKTIFRNPRHPYTIGLLNSIPRISDSKERLSAIPGSVPSPADYPHGCHFQPRCAYASGRCANEKPDLIEIESGHTVSCWEVEKVNQSFLGPNASPM